MLPTLWLVSLIPPLLISLWPCEPLFVYKGNEKVGEIISDACLAFFSAFPFWWLIEWFDSRRSKAAIAEMQQEFVSEIRKEFNHFVHQSIGGPFAELKTGTPDYAGTWSSSRIVETIEQHLLTKVRLGNLPAPSFDEFFLYSFTTLRYRLQVAIAVTEPSISSFPTSFRKKVFRLKEMATVMSNEEQIPSHRSIYVGIELIQQAINDVAQAYVSGPR